MPQPKQKVCSRGHKYTGNGPCPVCWPGGAKKKYTQYHKDGAKCKVVAGTHTGKSGIVQDINTSKTGAITVTVRQTNGVRFKTLARNIEVQ